jgi:hypothetical protein
MQNILIDIDNNAQNILPVPYLKSPTPSVTNPVNYGSSPYPTVHNVSSRKNDNLQYCNFLEPSPRNQKLNVPYEGEKNCPNFKSQPYDKDSCYLLDSKSQGVVGIVCNQPGGSNNSNFIRGNQVGIDYPFDFNREINEKKIEYNIKEPVQIPLEMQNPMMFYDRNTFYPEPSFSLRENKNFITYPLKQNYTKNGVPTYTYPYKTLNPIFKDNIYLKTIEKFDNIIKEKININFYIIFFIMIIFFIVYIFIYTYK